MQRALLHWWNLWPSMHSLIRGEPLQPALCLSLALPCLGVYMDENGSAPVPTVQYRWTLQVLMASYREVLATTHVLFVGPHPLTRARVPVSWNKNWGALAKNLFDKEYPIILWIRTGIRPGPRFLEVKGHSTQIFQNSKRLLSFFHKITEFSQNIASRCCKGTVHFSMFTWYIGKWYLIGKQIKQKCLHCSKEPTARTIVPLS